MPFIKSFSIDAVKTVPFPFNVSAVQYAHEVELSGTVTIFAGDNDTGKSTLLEAIAFKLNLALIEGYIKSHAGFEAARLLQPYLPFDWRRQTNRASFSGPRISVILSIQLKKKK